MNLIKNKYKTMKIKKFNEQMNDPYGDDTAGPFYGKGFNNGKEEDESCQD